MKIKRALVQDVHKFALLIENVVVGFVLVLVDDSNDVEWATLNRINENRFDLRDLG